MKSFWTASKARSPLILEVEESGGETVRYAFDRPYILIGRGLQADLKIDHPDVSKTHAYLQMIEGHPFLVDLYSRTGIYINEKRVAHGWAVPEHPIRIGTSRIWFRSGGAGRNDETILSSNPLSSRYYPKKLRSSTTLLVGKSGEGRPFPIYQTLTLIGRSPLCKIQFNSPNTWQFHCALLSTPIGVWVVDLRSTKEVSVNGAFVNHANLEDGDELKVGPLVARLSDHRSPERSEVPLETGTSLAPLRAVAPKDGSQGTDIKPFLDQAAAFQDFSGDQFGRMILMMTQMMGTMHREMVDLIRDELEQIRRLSAEIQPLRENQSAGIPTKLAATPSTDSANSGAAPRTDETGAVGPLKSRDPGEVHLIVAERLAAFEMAREGHWNKISRMLLGS